MDKDTTVIILAAALAVSEALAFIPAIRANGIFQLIFQILRALAGAKKNPKL